LLFSGWQGKQHSVLSSILVASLQTAGDFRLHNNCSAPSPGSSPRKPGSLLTTQVIFAVTVMRLG